MPLLTERCCIRIIIPKPLLKTFPSNYLKTFPPTEPLTDLCMDLLGPLLRTAAGVAIGRG